MIPKIPRYEYGPKMIEQAALADRLPPIGKQILDRQIKAYITMVEDVLEKLPADGAVAVRMKDSARDSSEINIEYELIAFEDYRHVATPHTRWPWQAYTRKGVQE
jgi:hypothetical protein